jgi:hypothetical protein
MVRLIQFDSICCNVLQFDENLEQWPHLNELVHCYTTDWVKDENKYGHYESIGTPSFQNQIYEGPDTDIETGISIFNSFLLVLHSASNFRK